MRHKIKISVLTGLLLAPATLASADKIDNPSVQIAPIHTANVVAEISAKDQLAAPFYILSEESSRTEVTAAKNIFYGMNATEKALFTANELALIEAKLIYVDQFPDFRLRVQALKESIDKLTLTSTTLLSDIPVVENSYTSLLLDLAIAEEDFKNAIPANTSALDPLLKNVKMYNYTESYNDDYLQQKTGNINVLKSRLNLLQNVSNVNTKIQAIDNVLAASNFDTNAFKNALADAQTAYALLTVDEKKVIDTYLPAGKTISYGKILSNAAAFLKAAETVDANVLAIESLTNATDFITKMKLVTTGYNALTVKQRELLLQEDKRKLYESVMTINNAITALKISSAVSYRTAIDNIITSYNALSPTELQKFVAKYDTVLNAKQDILAAEVVEARIDALKSNPSIDQLIPVRTQYNALSANAKIIVNNYSVLTNFEASAINAIKVVKLIEALNPASTKFTASALAAEKAYTSLTTERDKQLVYNYNVLQQLLPTAKIQQLMNTLKTSNTTYAADVAKIDTMITDAKIGLWPSSGTNTVLTAAQLDALKVLYDGQAATAETDAIVGLVEKITTLKNRLQEAQRINQAIMALAEISDADLLVPEIIKIRNAYNALIQQDAATKYLVKKYADFVTIEKKYQAALKVIQLVNSFDPKLENYLKTVLTTQKAYNNLDAKLKPYVYNYEILDIVSKMAITIQQIEGLKPSQKDYRIAVAKARASYDGLVTKYSSPIALKPAIAALTPIRPIAALTTEEQALVSATLEMLKGRLQLLVDAEAKIKKADDFDKRIFALANVNSKDYISSLKALSTEFKNMKAEEKKLVQNSKTLAEQEKLNKAVLKVIDLIDIIDASADDYTKKVIAARTAYDKLATKVEKDRVYNYSALTKVEGVAMIIYRIDGLKTSNKTFIADVKDLREQYDKLALVEKRAVVNYDQLVFMEGELAAAEVVINLIREAVPTAEKYLEKLAAARNAFDSLDASRKKIVANIQDLKERESSVKKILDVMKQIDQLNPDKADFAKNVQKAKESYLKLDLPQRALVSNLPVLEGYEPAAKVVLMISQLKPGSSTFHEDVKAARTAYAALGDKQSQVNNYSVLVTAENNIVGASTVDALIYALKNNDPKEYIKKVEEARSAFNNLTADQKKAVKYASVLKEEEAYVKPAKIVIDMIAKMFIASDMAQQYPKVQAAYAKLNDEQRKFIYNDYLLQDLDNVIKVYNRIATLKDTDPSYVSLVASIRRDYELLTTTEKSKVTNYSVLQDAELKIEAVKKVDELIFALSPKSPTYFDDIQKALDQYKVLPAALKKQLLYESALLKADTDKKAALKVIQMIQAIDENLRSFETDVLAAQEAFKLLTVDQQKLVSNYRLLEEYLTYL